MSHSYNKIWIHAIWSTKSRDRLITPEVEAVLYQYLHLQFKGLACPAQIINGMQKVYDYIKSQKEHHRLKTFEEEYISFLALYGFTEN